MDNNIHVSHGSDDEDLDSLRLNALSTLKRPIVTALPSEPTGIFNSLPQNHFSKPHKLKKFNKGFVGGLRGARNAPFNRVRNSNLIAVPTVETKPLEDFSVDIKITSKKFVNNSPAKLILPQDRYCGSLANTEEKNDSTSKFDRYNDSDDSESDSDDEKLVSSSDKELKRSNSLEALMMELENEIQGGETKPKDEGKTKAKAKKIEQTENKISNQEEEEKKVEENLVLKVVVKPKALVEKKPVSEKRYVPYNHKNQGLQQNMHTNHIHQPPYLEPNLSTPHLPPTFAPVPYSNVNVPYDQYGYPVVHHPLDALNQVQSPPNVRLSPLHIKTDILNTISAPLSPRSAAFVLQNRKIIERRKKSPRRSYSRSPSSEFRRSISPRYRRLSKSPSPLRNNRRSPPVRKPNSRRMSPIARRSSPNASLLIRRSPKQTRKSNERSPLRSHRSPSHQQNDTRNRLGVPAEKRFRKKSSSLSLSPSPERSADSKDPVLEARRRKFEEKNTPITEGIIRLKPKPDESDASNNAMDDEKVEEVEKVEECEDVAVDDSYIDFDHKVDLFSDEESDDENEGRFKLTSEQKNKQVPILAFSQLINGTSKNIEATPLLSNSKKSYDKDREQRDRRNRLTGRNDRYKSDRNRSRRSPEKSGRHRDDGKSKSERQRSRSPLRTHISNSNFEEKPVSKNEVAKIVSSERKSPKNAEVSKTVKLERRKSPIVSPIENRKIEIKIRHPSKYEEPKKDKDVAGKISVVESGKSKKVRDRKVEVAPRNFVEENEDGEIIEEELEVVEHNDEDDILIKTDVSGDLRAQLSRKRAERQNKVTNVDILPTRLLQNALQSAVYTKKAKKSKSKKSDKEAALVDNVEANVFAGVGRTAATTCESDVAIDNIFSAVTKERKVRVVHKMSELAPSVTDGKLPIHLRLGVPGGNAELFSDSKSHSNNKRIKNRGNLEQV